MRGAQLLRERKADRLAGFRSHARGHPERLRDPQPTNRTLRSQEPEDHVRLATIAKFTYARAPPSLMRIVDWQPQRDVPGANRSARENPPRAVRLFRRNLLCTSSWYGHSFSLNLSLSLSVKIWLSLSLLSGSPRYRLIASAYDQSSPNPIRESLLAVQYILNSPVADAAPVYLFLNFSDLFRSKATSVDLKCCFPDYTGADLVLDEPLLDGATEWRRRGPERGPGACVHEAALREEEPLH